MLSGAAKNSKLLRGQSTFGLSQGSLQRHHALTQLLLPAQQFFPCLSQFNLPPTGATVGHQWRAIELELVDMEAPGFSQSHQCPIRLSSEVFPAVTGSLNGLPVTWR